MMMQEEERKVVDDEMNCERLACRTAFVNAMAQILSGTIGASQLKYSLLLDFNRMARQNQN